MKINIRNILLVSIGLFMILSCRQKTNPSSQTEISAEEIRNKNDLEKDNPLLPDTIQTDSISIHGKLIFVGISFLIIENNSHLPVSYNSSYRFEQKIYGKWKFLNVDKQDTTTVFLYPGETDTLLIDLSKGIGYHPLGLSRVYKTIRTVSPIPQTFELMFEDTATAVPQQGTFLVKDDTILNEEFVEMHIRRDSLTLFVTLINKTDREITFGDHTNFTVSIYDNNIWKEIKYFKLEHNVAVILLPSDTIKNMKHTLPNHEFNFKPGKYRFMKKFFFGSFYQKKYTVGREFIIE